MKGDPEVNCRYQAIVASVRFLFAFSGSMSDMEISRQLTDYGWYFALSSSLRTSTNPLPSSIT